MIRNWLNQLKNNPNAWQHAIRLGLACALGSLIYHAFHLHMGYWALITAVITVQANLGASIKRAKDRLFGTLLGVLVGGFCLIVLPQNEALLLIVSLILIFLTVYLAFVSYIYTIFFGSILLILLLGKSYHTSGWELSVYRIIDTLIGIAIGLAVSYLIWPKNAKTMLYQEASKALEEVRNAFLIIIEGFQTNKFNRPVFIAHQVAIEQAIVTGRKLYEEYTHELGNVQIEIEAMYSILLNIEQINNILLTLRLAIPYPHTPDPKLQQQIGQFVDLINAICIAAYRAMVEHKVKPLDPYLTEFSDRLKTYIIEPEKLKSLMAQPDYKEYKLILFASNMRRLAIQINYIVESVRQLK